MKKKPNTGAVGVRVKILKALENPKWRYRTASGIAKETHLKVTDVEEVLKNNSAVVRVSLAKATDGSRLFASKKKVSAVGDVWTAFKAVNKAKYGR